LEVKNNMKIKLLKHHLDFFNKYLRKERPDLYQYLQTRVISIVFDIDDEDKEIDMSDWLGEKLQLIGFEADQEDLNEEGKIIEDIIDKFAAE
jgi:hypothetical protein